MAIGRGSMTKEMFGNRQPEADTLPMGMTPPPASTNTAPQIAKMSKGGKTGRGDGIAIKGKTKGYMC